MGNVGGAVRDKNAKGQPPPIALSSDTSDEEENLDSAARIQEQIVETIYRQAGTDHPNPNLDTELTFADNDCIEPEEDNKTIGNQRKQRRKRKKRKQTATANQPAMTTSSHSTKEESRKSLKDCNVILFQESIINCVKDGLNPSFDGLACLADGRVVIVDYVNSICCLYDSRLHNLMSSCTMSTKPWNVCTIDTDEVAVALPEEQKIQFLKIIGDTIQPSGHITTIRKCRALVALNKTELVYAGTMNDLNTYYWGTITSDGREKPCFHIPRGNITYSDVNIALNASKTRVYISCHEAKTVFCYGIDGKPQFEYKVQEGLNPGKPFGIALDSDDNVYVVVRNMNSIHRLSTECKLQQIIKKSIPSFPKAICFKQSGDIFYLTSGCTKAKYICYSYKLE